MKEKVEREDGRRGYRFRFIFLLEGYFTMMYLPSNTYCSSDKDAGN